MLCLDQLTEEVYWGLDHLVFLREDLDLERYTLKEVLHFHYGIIVRIASSVSKLAEVLTKLEVNTFFNLLKLEYSVATIVNIIILGAIFAHINTDPHGIYGLFALVVDVFRAKLEAGVHSALAI